jgi:hypothetical protein
MIDENTESNSLKWIVAHRIAFIRKTLDKKGEIRRKDIMAEYGISVAQASKALQDALRLEPNLMWYDKSKKCYRASVVKSHPEAGSRIDFDYCGVCGGTLDTGWECNKCGFDMRPYALMIPL